MSENLKSKKLSKVTPQKPKRETATLQKEEKKSLEFAIIKTGGKQYKVSRDQLIKVEKLNLKLKTVQFDDLLSKKKVAAEIVGEGRFPKIRVLKFHRRKRYRRLLGHRQPYTILKILNIK